MDKDILALISKDNSGFSKGQRLIAKYILENYDKAAFMTAGKLGKTVGVSESTVVRFAAELGFDGYPGMRKALQEMIRSRLTSVQRIEASKDMLDDKNILKSVMSDDIDKLQTTLEEIDQDTFNRVIDSIMGAKDIYIFASRTSRCLADFMAYYLGLLRPGVHLIDDNSAAGLFTGTLPVSRAQIVWGKYFFCTAFLLLADGVVLLVNRAAAGLLPPSVNPLPIGSLLALQFCGAAVIIAVSLPLILLLGSIRARYGLVAIYMAVFFLLFRYASEAGRGGIPPLPSDAVSLLWLVGAAALLASALITVCLYREHEYLQ